jgi:outer membrane protein
MINTLRNLAVGALLLLPVANLTAASPWSVRVRATYLETVDRSDAFTALGINFGADAISVNDKLIPEIDIDYAFTDSFSAELVLTIPQSQTVNLKGVGDLGSFKHLPPTLFAQYRFNSGSAFRPYIGLGLNFTLIWSDNLSVAGVPLNLDNYSVGLAGQAGFDWKINDRWWFNVDVKRAAIRSHVFAGAARLTEARLDPWLYSLGTRYEF